MWAGLHNYSSGRRKAPVRGRAGESWQKSKFVGARIKLTAGGNALRFPWTFR